ncbi:hypothetical protein MKX03_001545 [Papaver bracteatum]|nr:hypothetical protein MKX03_001545 [Papaver bracteatum]
MEDSRGTFGMQNFLRSPLGRILKRLIDIGLPMELRPVRSQQLGGALLDFVQQNTHRSNDVVDALLPSISDAEDYMSRSPTLLARHFQISAQALLVLCVVLQDNPTKFLSIVANARHVICEPNDLVYECQTCSRGLNSFICKFCFQNSQHIGHEFRSILARKFGRCDCGDDMTWVDGCSEHRAANHTPRLDTDVIIINTIVLDLLISHWRAGLIGLNDNADAAVIAYCNQFTVAFVPFLLQFFAFVPFLLQFCAGYTSHFTAVSTPLCSMGVLDILVRGERFFEKEAWELLAELIFTLLGDSIVRTAFSKVLCENYSLLFRESITQGRDVSILDKYRVVPIFADEVLSVPAIALTLVKDMNFLGVLLDCMKDLLSSCTLEDGKLQVANWSSLAKTNLVLMGHAHLVLRHVEVVPYATREELDNFPTWMRILGHVQGMAPQQRRTEEHVVEEDETRNNVFLLGLSITDVHSVLVDGLCSFAEIVRLSHLTLKAIDKWLRECLGSGKCEDRAGSFSLLSVQNWLEVEYDVSSQEVSVQLPLHRLISLLIVKSFREQIEKDEGSRNCEFFFGEVLQGCHPIGFSSFIMEHLLRIKVFCAQVRAGMWTRNGDVAVLNFKQCQLIHWSELDIFLLQCCAASAPPELFVTRVLSRFGLSSYLSLNPEDKYDPVLVLEMLTLIMHIIKERRFCGFSEYKVCKRDLICKLALGNFKHSELIEFLPRDICKNCNLEANIAEVAEYSLRLRFWKDLDVYHPRLSPQDAQTAEAGFIDMYADGDPAMALGPKWEDIFEPLSGICNIATSGSLLKIIRAVLYYSSLKPFESPKVVLISLHLLSLGLDICNMKIISREEKEDALPLLALATEEISGGPSVGFDAAKKKTLLSLLVSMTRMHKQSTFEAGKYDLSSLISSILEKFASLSVSCATELKILEAEVDTRFSMHSSPNSDSSNLSSSSVAEERKLKARARQADIMEKMKIAQSMFMESLAPEENVDAEVHSHLLEESIPIVCSICHDSTSSNPLSFLVLLQKSRLASFVERVPPMWGKSDGEKRLQSSSEATSVSNIEQLVQNAIDEFSHTGLPVELEGLVDIIKAQLDCTTNVKRPSTSYGASLDTLPSSIEMVEVNIYESVLKEMQNTTDANHIFSTEKDKEDLIENGYAQCALLGKYMASLSRQKSERASKNSRKEDASSEISGGLSAYDGFGPTGTDGIHISSCGHVMHDECRSRYLSKLRESYRERVIAGGGHSFDIDQGEFPCPLCRRLSNSVLPAISNTLSNLEEEIITSSSGTEPIRGSLTTSATNAFRISQSLVLLQSASKNIAESRSHITSLDCNNKMQTTVGLILNILSRMFYPNKHKKFLASGRLSHSTVLWDTLKYSLISTEIAARGARSNLCSGSGIEVLHRELESSSGFILSVLLKVVQITRNENLLEVLLRYRGVNLFAASICSGVSVNDEISPTTVTGIGDLSSSLKHMDKGVVYPDTQFWGRAADPVLARDPFSSLMWILFSLPSPFLSSVDCFLCLVHLFYGVSVIQVLITYVGKHQDVIPEFGLRDCLINDLRKAVGGTFARSYFASNYMDEASCEPRVMIRRMSYPYLRRCALLWKLLTSSTPTPFGGRSHETNRVSSNLNDSALESSLNDLPIKLNEVEELEQMFQIPDLDVVLEDRTLRMLGLKWINHFSREFQDLNYASVLHYTPAVPFRLMRLPHLYQDLLEHYIKQNCLVCGFAQEDPALCLLCGLVFSPGMVTCCRNEYQAHAMACGAGNGVYLLIRRNGILLHRSASHAPWPSPYLDAFGEEDEGLQRGKPLYLNEERYATLTNMVASHGLDQSSDVFRETTFDGLFME